MNFSTSPLALELIAHARVVRLEQGVDVLRVEALCFLRGLDDVAEERSDPCARPPDWFAGAQQRRAAGTAVPKPVGILEAAV
jgi:hypothetical protein